MQALVLPALLAQARQGECSSRSQASRPQVTSQGRTAGVRLGPKAAAAVPAASRSFRIHAQTAKGPARGVTADVEDNNGPQWEVIQLREDEDGRDAGGEDGNGGSVWVVGDASMTSLGVFRKQVHFRALKGANGEGKNCTGREGEDVVVKVPLGTIITNPETSQVLAEVLVPDQPRLVLRGGRGGRGNTAFKSNRNKAPMISEKGEEGLEMWLRLELQVVADVGIVGVPNAGKSTLLAALSAAKPKIASYPFTTLVPNLGVCEQDFQTTVFADIPGLVEGAHLGVGLGHEFLRHCLRCRVLVHLLDGSAQGAEGPIGDFEAIQTELAAFSPALANKPQIVVVNKLDIPEARLAVPAVQAHLAKRGVEVLAISAVTGQGVQDVVRSVRKLLAEQPAPPPPQALSERELERPLANEAQEARDSDLSNFRIVRDGRYFIVEGAALERFTQMTNWEFFESVRRFQFVLKKVGVWAALKAKGVKEGDPVVIGALEMQWADVDNEAILYEQWRKSQIGIGARGARHWPH